MNCWKTIDIYKDYGQGRLYSISFFICLLTFMIVFVPSSIYHHHFNPDGKRIVPFLIFLLALPTIHSITHGLPFLYKSKKLGIIIK